MPDGVLFGSSNAHVEARKKLVEDNRLDAVVSMPAGVFRPYAGVSTAILFFTKVAKTDRIWFYDMEHDGYSLDDKRQPVSENDISDVLLCWKNRKDLKNLPIQVFHIMKEVRRKYLSGMTIIINSCWLTVLRAKRMRANLFSGAPSDSDLIFIHFIFFFGKGA